MNPGPCHVSSSKPTRPHTCPRSPTRERRSRELNFQPTSPYKCLHYDLSTSHSRSSNHSTTRRYTSHCSTTNTSLNHLLCLGCTNQGMYCRLKKSRNPFLAFYHLSKNPRILSNSRIHKRPFLLSNLKTSWSLPCNNCPYNSWCQTKVFCVVP